MATATDGSSTPATTHERWRRRLVVGVLPVLGAVALIACGGDDSGSSTPAVELTTSTTEDPAQTFQDIIAEDTAGTLEVETDTTVAGATTQSTAAKRRTTATTKPKASTGTTAPPATSPPTTTPGSAPTNPTPTTAPQLPPGFEGIDPNDPSTWGGTGGFPTTGGTGGLPTTGGTGGVPTTGGIPTTGGFPTN